MIARVIVDIQTRALDRPFDYAVAPELAEEVEVGVVVRVPFGGRPAVGYVVEVTHETERRDLKAVEEVLSEPLFGSHAPVLAAWMAERYVCSLADALRPFLPPGGTPRMRRDAGGSYSLTRPGVGAVEDRWVEVSPGASADALPQRATRQRAVMEAVSRGPVRLAELRAGLGDVSSAVSRLDELGLVQVTTRRRWRSPDSMARRDTHHEDLTDGQHRALRAIADAAPGEAVLLDGVTGSGKTEVYMRAVEAALDAGRTAVVLVPEISLTPQTVGRFRARFGDDVAVLHSRLSAGERFDQWESARTGRASLVVGPRSALFAPLSDIGIIVVDEEHEGSYKQGSAPRYHARDVATRLAGAVGAVLILGSATPSLEARHDADLGRLVRVELPERATGASLPEVTVVDMGREFANGNRSMFSMALQDGIARVETSGTKAVLLLNRRGFASFLLCRECGFVPTCESCSVSLTYHEERSRLVCHHCARERDVPGTCPECGSVYLRQFGAGTQRVVTELTGRFPDLPVVRMDADTTAGKGGHEARLAEFEALDSGVLVGTQMIAKGLDYPEVTLVGVLGADLGLRLPDYRAGERTYQLLSQVAGRAGRGDLPGSVVIQTYWPDHPAVEAAAAHDAEHFYGAERESRRQLGYPPFGALARLLLTGPSRQIARTAATDAASALRGIAPDEVTILGPSPAPLERIRGVHRWHILLRGPDVAALAGLLHAALEATSAPEGAKRIPDVDPYDLL